MNVPSLLSSRSSSARWLGVLSIHGQLRMSQPSTGDIKAGIRPRASLAKWSVPRTLSGCPDAPGHLASAERRTTPSRRDVRPRRGPSPSSMARPDMAGIRTSYGRILALVGGSILGGRLFEVFATTVIAFCSPGLGFCPRGLRPRLLARRHPLPGGRSSGPIIICISRYAHGGPRVGRDAQCPGGASC